MKKPVYTIPELEQYLLQKRAGQINPVMEQTIREDVFLQTVVIGLEKTMMEQKLANTRTFTEKKKGMIWRRLESLQTISNSTTTTSAHRIFKSVQQYFSISHYDPQYLRIHLLLSFNCSCVLVFVALAWWLKQAGEAGVFLRHFVELVGDKI